MAVYRACSDMSSLNRGTLITDCLTSLLDGWLDRLVTVTLVFAAIIVVVVVVVVVVVGFN